MTPFSDYWQQIQRFTVYPVKENSVFMPGNYSPRLWMTNSLGKFQKSSKKEEGIAVAISVDSIEVLIFLRDQSIYWIIYYCCSN